MCFTTIGSLVYGATLGAEAVEMLQRTTFREVVAAAKFTILEDKGPLRISTLLLEAMVRKTHVQLGIPSATELVKRVLTEMFLVPSFQCCDDGFSLKRGKAYYARSTRAGLFPTSPLLGAMTAQQMDRMRQFVLCAALTATAARRDATSSPRTERSVYRVWRRLLQISPACASISSPSAVL